MESPKVCQICGRTVSSDDESVPWLTGVAHAGCKGKEEKRMQSGSDTVFGKENKPV